MTFDGVAGGLGLIVEYSSSYGAYVRTSAGQIIASGFEDTPAAASWVRDLQRRQRRALH